MHFEAIKTWTVGKTVNIQWVATAPFLAAPYYGADAYETHAGLLEAQVTTFMQPSFSSLRRSTQ